MDGTGVGGTETIVVEYTMTLGELRRTMLAYTARSRNVRVLVALFVLVVVLGAVVGPAWVPVYALGVLVVVLIMMGVTVLRAGRRFPAMLQPIRLEFSPGGLAMESTNGTSNVRWTLYRDVVVGRSTIYLRHRGTARALAVPRRALRPGDEERLLALLREHVHPE